MEPQHYHGMASASNPLPMVQVNPSGQPIYQSQALTPGILSPSEKTNLSISDAVLQGLREQIGSGEAKPQTVEMLAQLGRVMKQKMARGFLALNTLQSEQSLSSVARLSSESTPVLVPPSLGSNTDAVTAVVRPTTHVSIPDTIKVPWQTVTDDSIQKVPKGQLRPAAAQERPYPTIQTARDSAAVSSHSTKSSRHTIPHLTPTSATSIAVPKQHELPSIALPLDGNDLLGHKNVDSTSTPAQNRKRPLECDSSASAEDSLQHGKQRKTSEESPQFYRLIVIGCFVSVSREKLNKYFSKYGYVKNVQRYKVKENGLITFQTPDQCAAAYTDGLVREKSWHCIKLTEVECIVQGSDAEIPAPCKLFLGGLGRLTVEDLQGYFYKYGNIEDIKITPIGVGFIQFESPSQVEAAFNDGRLRVKSQHCIDEIVFECKIDEKVIAKGPNAAEIIPKEVTRAMKLAKEAPATMTPIKDATAISLKDDDKSTDQEKADPCRLFVGGIRSISEEQLHDYFSKYGEIKTIILPGNKYKPERKRGYGLITFASPSQAQAAYQHGFAEGKSLHCIGETVFGCEVNRVFEKVEKTPEARSRYTKSIPVNKSVISCYVCSCQVSGVKNFRSHVGTPKHVRKLKLKLKGGLDGYEKLCKSCHTILKDDTQYMVHIEEEYHLAILDRPLPPLEVPKSLLIPSLLSITTSGPAPVPAIEEMDIGPSTASWSPQRDTGWKRGYDQNRESSHDQSQRQSVSDSRRQPIHDQSQRQSVSDSRRQPSHDQSQRQSVCDNRRQPSHDQSRRQSVSDSRRQPSHDQSQRQSVSDSRRQPSHDQSQRQSVSDSRRQPRRLMEYSETTGQGSFGKTRGANMPQWHKNSPSPSKLHVGGIMHQDSRARPLRPARSSESTALPFSSEPGQWLQEQGKRVPSWRKGDNQGRDNKQDQSQRQRVNDSRRSLGKPRDANMPQRHQGDSSPFQSGGITQQDSRARTSGPFGGAALPFSPDPGQWLQDQGKVPTPGTSMRETLQPKAHVQAEFKRSKYQQKKEETIQQFQFRIPDILKENPNWKGEIKGTEYVKPGFNCNVCCSFCDWDKETEGSLSTASKKHCFSPEHKSNVNQALRNAELSITSAGVLCEVCNQFFGLNESQFADVIAKHCVSLKHHVHIRLHRLQNNMKLPKWLQIPPFTSRKISTPTLEHGNKTNNTSRQNKDLTGGHHTGFEQGNVKGSRQGNKYGHSTGGMSQGNQYGHSSGRESQGNQYGQSFEGNRQGNQYGQSFGGNNQGNQYGQSVEGNNQGNQYGQSFGGNNQGNQFGQNFGGKSQGNQYGQSSGGKSESNQYGQSSGGKSQSNQYGQSSGGKSQSNQFGQSSGEKSQSNQFVQKFGENRQGNQYGQSFEEKSMGNQYGQSFDKNSQGNQYRQSFDKNSQGNQYGQSFGGKSQSNQIGQSIGEKQQGNQYGQGYGEGSRHEGYKEGGNQDNYQGYVGASTNWQENV